MQRQPVNTVTVAGAWCGDCNSFPAMAIASGEMLAIVTIVMTYQLLQMSAMLLFYSIQYLLYNYEMTKLSTSVNTKGQYCNVYHFAAISAMSNS